MKYLYMMALVLFSIGQYNAQTAGETADLVSSELYGSARVVGVNGAFGAMGGDFSSTMINPAGIGEYKKGEFVFTPSYETSETIANSNGGLSNGRLGFDQIGVVFSNDGESFVKNNFVLGYNKSQSFHNSFLVNEKSAGSVSQLYVEDSNGYGPYNLTYESGLAYDAGIIYLNNNSNDQYGQYFPSDEMIDKKVIRNRKGTAGEYMFGWAGNYKRKFKVGFTIGIPVFSYKDTQVYTEEFNNSKIRNSLNHETNVDLRGSGINLKLGALYTAKHIRLGIALHTPTAYEITSNDYDEMTFSTVSDIKTYKGNSSSQYNEAFIYSLISPFKAIGSVGSIFKTGDVKGFVNLDVEHQNYGTVKYDLASESEDPLELEYTQILNNELQGKLGSVNIARLGGELAFKYFRLRGGVSYGNYTNSDDHFTNWSLGTGYSGDRKFIDVAYRVSNFGNNYETNIPVNAKNRKGLFSATVGFRF